MGNTVNTHKPSLLNANKFLITLISLFGLILIHPLINDLVNIRFLVGIFMSFIFLAGIYAVSFRKHHFIIALVLALPTFILMWTGYFIQLAKLENLKNLFGMFFMLYMIVLFLMHFFRQTEINREVIFGALVVYMLMGLMWAYGYAILDHLLPGSFNYPDSLTELDVSALHYFSFVTMTTLGYGDISPISGPAKAMAMTQAITGQIYLAVLVARLVGINIAQQMTKKE
jgi:hypothetical protein